MAAQAIFRSIAIITTMLSGPKVPISRRRGTSAEAEVEARLSYFSIVARPSPDVGIDFQCELLQEDQPSGELFGVQVKGTKTLGKRPQVCVKKTTIRYWLKLTFPVYIIVYDEESQQCYWISFTRILDSVTEKIESKNSTVCFDVDRTLILHKGESKDFVSKVRYDALIMSLQRGSFKPSDKYVRTFPIAYLSQQVIANHQENIRNSLNLLINHYLLTEDIEKAYSLCSFLAKLDNSHYDHFYKLGHIEKLLGNRIEAKRNFERAITICKGDEKWNLLKDSCYPPIEEIVLTIEEEIRKLDAGR